MEEKRPDALEMAEKAPQANEKKEKTKKAWRFGIISVI
jgi:hypothetical protein